MNGIGKAQNVDILNHLFTQIVIDSEELFFSEQSPEFSR